MKPLTIQQAKEKIRSFCAYQERCHQEVRTKLYSLGMNADETGELLAYLVVEGFLNEERFAKAFAGGKFRMKKWGRLRIVRELEKRDVSKNCIRAGLSEIDADDYSKTLADLLERKRLELDEPDQYVLRDKLSKYAIMKGYEPEMVWSTLRELVPDQR